MSAKELRKRLLLLMPAILLAGGGVWFGLHQFLPRTSIRHVVLISLDTCRADHLSCYGYAQATTPHIDALAKNGYLFSNAVTPIPLTLPAHASMLTGTIPPHHGKHQNTDVHFDLSTVTLATLLRTKGYRTGGFVGAKVLNRHLGLDRGFDIYHDRFAQKGQSERRAEEVNRAAFAWLEKQQDNRVFLFLHYYDPHDAYDPPEPFATPFKESPYAGEIAYADHCIGQVVAKLKSLGMYDSSLIIVTADHGEMLGEHGENTHMYFIYQSALKVPMVYRLPGSNTAREIDDLASIIDIVPTVCDLVDIDPPAGIQGESLAPYLDNKPPRSEDRDLYCESLYPRNYEANSLLGLVSKRWKYIQTTRPELYDLQDDPGELTNIVETRPHQARILRDRLAQVLEETVRRKKDSEEKALDAESLRHLRSLGYVAGSGVEEDLSFDQSQKDPKDLIGFHNEFLKVIHLGERNRIADARGIGERLLEQGPRLYELYELLSNFAAKQQDHRSVIRYGQRALALKPGSFNLHNRLGVAYAHSSQKEAAAEHLERALEFTRKDQTVPLDARILAHNLLAMIRAEQNNFNLAIVQFEETLALKPEQPRALSTFARLLAVCPDRALRNSARALELAQQACALSQSKQPEYLSTLAVAYAELNDFSEAIKTSELALALARAKGDQPLIARLKTELERFVSRSRESE